MFEEDNQTLSCFMISIEKEKQTNANESFTPVHEEYNADSEDDYTDRTAQRAIDLLNRCNNLLYDMQSYIEERSENSSPINIISGIRYDFDNPNGPHPEDCICKVCQPPPARSPSLYSCCNEIICRCNEDNYSIDTEEYNNSWERQINGNVFSDYSEENQINIEEYIAWTMCGMDRQALENMYLENIKIKQVIAGQPINHGRSRCTMECDTENHHMHTYCTMCKKNLFYGTTIHDCIIGFTLGKIRPDMNPKFLINNQWWKEPQAVQLENNINYLKYIERLINDLPVHKVSLEPFIANLD
ncbi:unnamed protein product [Rhizophagus irregularis]|nr:unnamed protein product [Rhizophagus irregularis]